MKEQSTKGFVPLLVVCCGNVVSRSARERSSGVVVCCGNVSRSARERSSGVMVCCGNVCRGRLVSAVLVCWCAVATCRGRLESVFLVWWCADQYGQGQMLLLTLDNTKHHQIITPAIPVSLVVNHYIHTSLSSLPRTSLLLPVCTSKHLPLY